MNSKTTNRSVSNFSGDESSSIHTVVALKVVAGSSE